MKRCGLYIRVSTDRQAKVEEGSLRNQEHALRQHIELKNGIGQDQWIIVEQYIDEGCSAKDTNRPAYQRMIEDVRRERINAVVCLALSRISRSTRDLLEMIEFFDKHGVDFICLKESYDTSTPQGRFLVTLMGGLNQFEREQTGERTRAAFLARAERGLWNGSQLYGYDVDPKRKGYLKVNERETSVVRLAFETYLIVGSVFRVREMLNETGHRTKVYTSRRGHHHPAAPFSRGALYKILTNHAYVGQKEVNKYNKTSPQDKLPEAERYRLVDAVWPGVVAEETFYAVQRLLEQNRETRNNNASPTKHFYLLNGGILYCHRCGSQMEGRNGHGHRGRKVYYYYFCKNKDCRFKLPQGEIEAACAILMGSVAQSDHILPKVVNRLNQRLRSRAPRLVGERKRLESELRQVNGEAQQLLARGDALGTGRVFVQERLQALTERRQQVESELERNRHETAHIDDVGVDEAVVRRMLEGCQAVFGEDMQPYKRKELLKLAVRRFELSDTICRAGLKLSPALLGSDRSTEKDALPRSGRGATSIPHEHPLSGWGGWD